MTDLLDHAIDAAKRLPPEKQDTVAKAIFALIENDAGIGFDLFPTGPEPTEEEILALLPSVMPSALPTKAEVAAWNRLAPDEQFRRYQKVLNRPGNDEPVSEILYGG